MHFSKPVRFYPINFTLALLFALTISCNSVSSATATFSTSFLASLSAAPLSRNSFVIAYCDNTSAKIAFKIYQTDGTQLLSETNVDTTLGTNPCDYTSVSVSAFDNTYFVIGWIDSGSSYASFQVFNMSGSAVSSRVNVDTTAGTSMSVSVSAFNSTAFVFGWYDQPDLDASFQTYSILGSAISSVVDVDTRAGTCNAVSVSAFNSTAFVFGYYDQASSDMTFRTYTSSGTAISAITDVDTRAGANSRSISVSAINTSAFAILWYDQNSGYVRFRVYSVSGTIVGSEVVPDTAVGTTASGIMVSSTGLNDSVFVVGWNDLTTDTGVSAMAYSASGSAVSSEVVVQSNSLKYNALASRQAANNIQICDNNYMALVSNTTAQAFFRAYYMNGTEWNGECLPPSMNLSNITSSEPKFYYNATLLGWCNATHPDSQDISYYYKWYLNGNLNKTGQSPYYAPEISVNVDNISSSYLSIGQNWTLECTAYDGISNSTQLNSSTITIVNTNVPPSILSISLDDTIPSPAGQIDLTAGSITKVVCNGTLEDLDGFSDIANAAAIIYASGNGTLPTSPEDNNTLYRNLSCSLSQINTTSAYFNCSFDIWYYAQNGTWTCNTTATDSQSASGSAVANSTVNNLIAFNVSSMTLDYGNLAPGVTSPSSVLFYITNLGNTRIDLSLNGSDMSCPAGTIPASNQHYNITGTDQAYAQMRALSNSEFLASDFNLDKKVTSDSNRTTYWRIQIPQAVKGSCTGIIALSAQQG